MKLNSLKKSKTGWKKRIIFLFLLIFLVLIMLNLQKSLQKSGQINKEITGLQSDVQNLEKNNLELKELVEYFNSDAFIEERARVDLGLKKEGESVVLLPPAQASSSNGGEKTDSGNDKEKTNAQKWWNYFFN